MTSLYAEICQQLPKINETGRWHQAVSRELGCRVANRDFSVSFRVVVRQVPYAGVDFAQLASAVEGWLTVLDPDVRSADPTVRLESGPLEITLRAHGKPEALRGRGRLIDNRVALFPNPRNGAALRRCA